MPSQETELNHDFCDACGDGGDLLCCDNCPCAFHFNCINPPMHPDNLPEGDWFCGSCSYSLGKVRRDKRCGKLTPILDLILKSNPKEFYVPYSIVKGSSSHDPKEEFRTMDILELITIPTTASYRYTVDQKSEPSRKRKTNICSTCKDKGDDLLRCAQCKNLYHRWCIDPIYVGDNEEWICPDHRRREMANMNMPINYASDEIEEGEIWDNDQTEESITLDFSRAKLPIYLQHKKEEMFVPGRYDSDDEFSLDSKRKRPKRNIEIPQAMLESQQDQQSKAKSPDVKQKQPLKPKSKSYVNIQTMDPRTKTWCLKKLKIEQNMLTKQLVDFNEFCTASSAQKKTEAIEALTKFQPSIPREYTALTEENSFSSVVKNLDRNYLIEYKHLFDEGVLRNTTITDEMIKFLAWQRVNQLLMQNTLQLHFPHKPKKSKSERRASIDMTRKVLGGLREIKEKEETFENVIEWLGSNIEQENLNSDDGKKRDYSEIDSTDEDLPDEEVLDNKYKKIKREDSIEDDSSKEEKTSSPSTNPKKLKFKMSADKVFVCYLNEEH